MQHTETKNTIVCWKKLRRQGGIWSKTHTQSNRLRKGTNDVRKTDMGLFQRTGKKPQRESWQKVSRRVYLQFSEKPNAALQAKHNLQQASERAEYQHAQWAHRKNHLTGYFCDLFCPFYINDSFLITLCLYPGNRTNRACKRWGCY